MEYISYASQWIDEDDITAVKVAMQKSLLTRGQLVCNFEQSVADFCGARFAVAFNSGTSALSAAYFAAKTTPLDMLFTSTNTFIGTISGGVSRGSFPVFVDINPYEGNLDLDHLDALINRPSTRGREIIIPVHFGGFPVRMDVLSRMIKRPDTVIIEDAAHAFGSEYSDGDRIGSCSYSDMTIFSLHPSKNITTGEGGLVTTNSEEYYDRLLMYRNNGIVQDLDHLKQEREPWYYEVKELSGNFHLTDFQAALGMSQLNKLDKFISIREEFHRHYISALSNIEGIQVLHTEKSQRIGHHLCVVLIDFERFKTTRGYVMQCLKEEGIGSQVHYIPMYRHPCFEKYITQGEFQELYPGSELYYSQALTLPLHCKLDFSQINHIVDTLKRVLKN
ncbi:MAG: UDP-4-amino-4,6-dideoxy-N-acetyl-beta-L-altrosami ne transaminase [Chlamydiales bacterium]